MDDKQWQDYERQHRELKREYRRLRWRIVWIWLGYFALSTAALWLFVYPWRMEVGVVALLLNAVVSVFLMLFAINGRLKEEQSQRQALIEKAPVGKMQL